MSEASWIAIATVATSAVLGPVLLAVVNHALNQRNESRRKAIEVAEAQDKRIRHLEREVDRLTGVRSRKRVVRRRVSNGSRTR